MIFIQLLFLVAQKKKKKKKEEEGNEQTFILLELEASVFDISKKLNDKKLELCLFHSTCLQ